MTLYEFHLVFPDGQTRISLKRTAEDRGLVVTWYFLEQLSAIELLAYT